MKKMGFVASFMSVAGVSALLASSILTTNVSAQVDSGIKAATTSEMQGRSVDATVGSIVDVLMWVVGILSVVMIAWSGFRYITSAGDASKLASAKNTLIYAIVGLIVAIMAYAIVTFVRERTSPATKSTGSVSSPSSSGSGSGAATSPSSGAGSSKAVSSGIVGGSGGGHIKSGVSSQ